MTALPPSFTNTGRRGSMKPRASFAFFSRPAITISLDGVDSTTETATPGSANQAVAAAATQRVYSTMDEIKGTVSVTVTQDTSFDEIEIALSGKTKVAVDKVAPATSLTGQMAAEKEFLNLQQPIAASAYPSPRVLEPGRAYTFPFTFKIPQQLPSRSCVHPAANSAVRDAHHLLPPTLADPGAGKIDDLAPDMGKIKYGIRAVLYQAGCAEGEDRILVEKVRKLRVIPAVDEEPPLSVEANNDEYTLRAEKNVRKNFFGSKLGRLVVETRQPRSFHLPPPSNDNTNVLPAATTVTLNLRFDPAEGQSSPPRLATLTSKLRAFTYFRLSPSRDFPNHLQTYSEPTSGVHFLSLSLATRDMASTKWTRHDGSASSRPSIDRTSLTSDGGPIHIPDASAAYKNGAPYYTAQLPIPLTLPRDKALPPTFHSCLVSRIYRLDLNLSLHAPKPSAPSVSLKVPVQISVARSETAAIAQLPQFSAVEALNDADAVFVPRVISPMDAAYAERSAIGRGSVSGPAGEAANDEPPTYHDTFAPQGSVSLAVC